MGKFVFQRGVRKSWLGIATLFGSPVRRCQRRFVAAEALESRALLSATGTDSAAVPPQEIAPADATRFGSDSVRTLSADRNAGLNLAAESNLINRTLGGSLDTLSRVAAPEFSFGLNDAVFEAIAQSQPGPQAPDADRPDAIRGPQHSGPFSDVFASFSERSVELRFAETGQVVAVGSSSAVQDSNGLTVANDGAPTTYLHATDADGRTFSRLVFVTRTSRPVPSVESAVPADASNVVVADAELTDEALADELAARPDLHDLETALDAANPGAATSPSEDDRPLLAATTRTLRTYSARTPTESATASETAASTRKVSANQTADDENSSMDELSAVPVFDPTTRNVVLSVCVLGALARANARRRRRQKVALAQ